MIKYFFVLFFLSCIAFDIAAQPATMDITYKKPLRYEKRNGKLQVLATIPLKAKTVSVLLDSQPMDILRISQEQTEVWLPLVGDKKLLQVYINNQATPVASQLFSPLIPRDWGYFQNGTIHIISSSHQDIAWMNTPDSCRHE